MDFSEHYKSGEVAKTYDKKRLGGFKAPIVRKLERIAIISLLKNKYPKILEIGVGTGFITEILLPYGKVHGLDTSLEMIKIARKKFPQAIIKYGNVLEMKDSDKKYDLIVTVRVLSHFRPKQFEAALINLRNNSSNGGEIIFNVENPSLIRRFVRKITNWGSTYTYQYSSQELDRILKKCKLRIVKKTYVDHSFFIPLHLLNILFFRKLDNLIIKIEKKISGFGFMSANTFIKCQK